MKASVEKQRHEPVSPVVLPARRGSVVRASASRIGAGHGVIDSVSRVDGLAVAVAMNNAGGSPEFLREVLGRFAELYAAGEPGFLLSPAVDNLPHWRTLCHSVRGAAAIVGAVSVSARAESLERAMRAGDCDPAEVAVAGRCLHETLQDFSARLAAALETSSHA